MNDKIKLNDVEVPVDEAVAALTKLGYEVRVGRRERAFGILQATVSGMRPADGKSCTFVRIENLSLDPGGKINSSFARRFAKNIITACNWAEGKES